jgi:hypothetical protein
VSAELVDSLPPLRDDPIQAMWSVAMDVFEKLGYGPLGSAGLCTRWRDRAMIIARRSAEQSTER